MTAAFICDAIRTPIGRAGGVLSTIRTDDLAALPIRELLLRHPQLDPAVIDDVILGCANQAGEDNRNVARMAALLAGLPVTVPGVTVNRLCASGAQAVGSAARAIASGEAELMIAGGVESMSRSPYVLSKAGGAFARDQLLADTTVGWRFINAAMHALHGTDSNPETAENVAQIYGLTRREQDAFALRSQLKAGLAITAGYFHEEIMPVHLAGKKGEILIDGDEPPRPDTTAEALARLKPIVHAGGSVTAGNASGINDGAAALLIASEKAARTHGLRPRARILGTAVAGVEPRVMGIGPVPATRKLLARLNLRMEDFDVIEINEAFAAQVIASMRDLGVDALSDERVNPYGGAIALGHPLGMSGARLCLTALRALEICRGKRALVTMCIGVGQGLSMALERI